MSAISDWACNYCGWNVVGKKAFLVGPPDEESRSEQILICGACFGDLRELVTTTEPPRVVAALARRGEGR